MLSSPVVLEYDYLKNSGVKGRVLDGILALVSNGLAKTYKSKLLLHSYFSSP